VKDRTSGQQSTRYIFAAEPSPVFEVNMTGQITEADIDAGAADLAHYTGPPAPGTPATFIYYSGHGDVVAEADSAGNQTSSFSYDPFGVPLQQRAANTWIEGWTGKWDKKYDTTSMLVEMGARPYDPSLGRFYAIDPVQGGSFNNYDFAYQDPINNFDLDGNTANAAGEDLCWDGGPACQAFYHLTAAQARALARCLHGIGKGCKNRKAKWYDYVSMTGIAVCLLACDIIIAAAAPVAGAAGRTAVGAGRAAAARGSVAGKTAIYLNMARYPKVVQCLQAAQTAFFDRGVSLFPAGVNAILKCAAAVGKKY
jgi:RHS repeat-associated protein